MGDEDGWAGVVEDVSQMSQGEADQAEEAEACRSESLPRSDSENEARPSTTQEQSGGTKQAAQEASPETSEYWWLPQLLHHVRRFVKPPLRPIVVLSGCTGCSAETWVLEAGWVLKS